MPADSKPTVDKSKTQINGVYHALKFIFKYAKINNLIARDPTENLQKPTGYSHPRRALTATERRYFIQVGLTDRRYFYFMLMLFCGCRPGEAAAAKGYDLSVRDRVPTLHIRGSKTDHADRFVPVPLELWDKIKRTPKDEYIAQTASGGPITINNRRRIWNSLTRRINIAMGCRMYRNALVPPYPLSDDLVPYCLRHEYCTELARRGVDIRIAQKLMGHASIKMTANIYTNLETDDVITAADAIGAVLPEKGATLGATSNR
ncbi:MAG: tyrosine-type recombinase/integrase [Anaerovoracaceae bacterium]|jgi:integrase